MTSAASVAHAGPAHRLATNFRLLEIVVLVGLSACGLWLFFGRAIESHFSLHPGDLGDWRLNGVIVEHWFAVLKGQAEWRSPNFFYPVKNALGFCDSLFLFLPFYLPFRLAGIEPSLSFVFCFMSIITFGFVTSYWFMSRSLGLPKIVAFGASFAFVFSNMAAIHLSHAQLYAYAFLPLLFACAIKFSVSVLERRPSIAAGVGFSVVLAAILYTGFYVGYSILVFLMFFLPVLTLLSAWGDRNFTETCRAVWNARWALVACAAAFSIALVPFLLTYIPGQKEMGFRDWAMVECMLPFPRDFLNVDGNAAWHWLVLRFGPDTRPCRWELTFGLPLGTQCLFALSLVWLLFAWRSAPNSPASDKALDGDAANSNRQIRVVLSLALAVVLCWLAMLRLDQGSLWYILYSWLPAATAIRAVFRFQMVLHFFVLIVIGFALSRFIKSWPKIPGLILQVVVMGGLAIEHHNIHKPYFEGEAESKRISSIGSPPTACRQFYVDPEGAKASPSYMGHLAAMIVARRYGLPTLNGYSSAPPNGLYHTEFSDPLYLSKVASWVRTHKLLDGLCILDLSENSWRELSVSLSGIREALLDKNVLTFSDPMEGFAFDRSGFHSLESTGAWTAGNADIAFTTPIQGVRKVMVSGHRGFPLQQVSISVGAEKIVVDPSVNRFQVEITTAQPVSSIKIMTDAFVPAAVGLGPDTRRLGVFLDAVVLKSDRGNRSQ